MKLTVENVMNEEAVQEVPKRAKKTRPPKQPVEEVVEDDEDEGEDDEDGGTEVPALSQGSRAFIMVIFIAGMILFAFMAYMVLSNLNLVGNKDKSTTEEVTTEAVTTEATVSDATPKDEQIKKLQEENADLKAQLAAEKQRTTNGTNYDETIKDLNNQLKEAQDALSASQEKEKALQQQLNGQTADKQ